MAEQPLHIPKQYYAIGEVAQLFKVSTSLLRYWEKEFKPLKPQKNKQGIRRYTQADIEILTLIHDLIKKQGYTIKGAQEALKNHHKKPQDTQTLILALKKLKGFLVDLKQ